MERTKAATAARVDDFRQRSVDHSNAESSGFELALAPAAANLETLHSAADALLSENRLDEARVVFGNILDREPTNIRAMMALTRIERRLGDNRAACARLRAASHLSPDNLHVLAELAAVLRDMDQQDEATSVYGQILAKDGNHVTSHMGLAWIARARGNNEAVLAHFGAACEHLRLATADDPGNLHLLTQLATALRGMNRVEEAKPLYQKILALEAKHTQAHIGLGWIAREGGNDEAALAHFKAAAESDPIDAQLQINLGKFYLQTGRSEEAEQTLRRVALRAPDNSQVRASLGFLARTRGDWLAALQEFRAAAESDPNNVPVCLDLARILCDLDRWDEAEPIFRSVLKDSPRNLEALIGMGTVAKAQGDLRSALGWFKEASVVAPFDLRPKREMRRLEVTPGAYDWRAEIEEAAAVTHATDVPVERQLEAAKILVEYGLTEAARPVLSRLEANYPAARQLLLAVRQIERMGLARPLSDSGVSDPAEAQIESFQGFLEMPVPGSDTVLIVFGGTNNRLWMTFSLLHRILRKMGVTVIYCRDLQRAWYARGIIGLGDDFQSTVDGFRTLVSRHGATRVLTLGNCSGCLPALRYGLSLGAQGVLALSPKLRLRAGLNPDQRTQLKPMDERLPTDDKNVHTEYLEVSPRPNVALIFGENCADDACVANVMSDVPGISLASIPDSRDTDSVKDLLVRGLFEPLLRDFVAHGVVSQETHAQISTSRNP